MGGRLATMRATWLVLVGCMQALCEAAYGFDYPLAGTKLVIKATPTAGKIAFVSKDGTSSVLPGGADDPTIVGGTFKVFDPATSESAVFDLPASNWSAPSFTVRKFVNKAAPAGVSPVRSAMHSSFKIGVMVP